MIRTTASTVLQRGSMLWCDAKHSVTAEPSVCVQVSCLAEKTGEDSARMSAPVALHGSEEYVLQDDSLPHDPGLKLEFACERILVLLPSHLIVLYRCRE